MEPCSSSDSSVSNSFSPTTSSFPPAGPSSVSSPSLESMKLDSQIKTLTAAEISGLPTPLQDTHTRCHAPGSGCRGGAVHAIGTAETQLAPAVPCAYKALTQLQMGTPISAGSVSTSGSPCAPSPSTREGQVCRGQRVLGHPPGCETALGWSPWL